MIEVFKTNVEEQEEAKRIIHLLQEHFPGNRINFDLHDCDRVLRIEGRNVAPEKVVTLMIEHGFNCRPLE